MPLAEFRETIKQIRPGNKRRLNAEGEETFAEGDREAKPQPNGIKKL